MVLAAIAGSPPSLSDSQVRLSAASPASGRLLEGSPDPDTDDESSLEAQARRDREQGAGSREQCLETARMTGLPVVRSAFGAG